MTTLLDVRAPQEQSEGTRSQISRWLKAIGERVALNEPLIELESDKVLFEMPAPATGVLREILKGEQEEVEANELLARIELATSDEATISAEVASTKTVPAEVTESPQPAPSQLSPAVRRLLEEHKLDAAVIQGSGEGGRVTAKDVERYVAAAPATSSRVDNASVENSTSQRIPHTLMRKRIAQRMVESLLHTSPHVTSVFSADLGAVMAHRAKHRVEFERQGAALTLTAYFIAACVAAIRAVPETNARWTDEAMEIFDSINIGIATAIEDKGLVVPVMRNVAALDLAAIARQLADMTSRARQDRLTPADVRGGTFTISNHGVSGSVFAAPIIINQPQSAILGIGKLEKRVVVLEREGSDVIAIRPSCYVSLTIDHRVMDGHRANRFLQVFVATLEAWPTP